MTRMTDQIGRVLGGRYRLLSPLGSGASAQVYLADDVRLRRRVAVKVLHPALADDESFLRRFRAEAQAAAALGHPHLLAVYDWSDTETPYLVTEYLGGGSLRALLDSGWLLSLSQALVVGLEAVRALDHAHRQGFVHRDIKPANLLFGDDGRLRVADFGLARAIAEAGWTEPDGAVLGTARYASPEQARGESVDGRSDVYSLAIVLIEAVTGSVPFSADTTIGTLMARLDRSLEVPAEMGPLVPILTDAGRLDPEARLDAAGFGAGLVATAPALPRPEPLPLVGTAEPEPAPTDRRVTTLMGPTVLAAAVAPVAGPAIPAAGADPPAVTVTAATRAAGGPDASATTTLIPPSAARPTGSDRTGVMAGSGPATRLPGPPAAPPTLLAPTPWDAGGPPDRPRLSAGDRGVRRLMLGALVVAVAIACGIVGAAFYMRAHVPSHTIPTSLINAQKDQVVAGVADFGWKIETEEVRQDGTVPGQVLATDPRPGTELKEGKTLTLTVSLGPTLVPLPEGIVGATKNDASDALEAAGLAVEVVPQPDDSIDEGIVIGFADPQPPAEGVPKGSTVRLLVSTGTKVEIPDLEGVAVADATAQLQGLGLNVQVRAQSPDDDHDAGEVIGTDPDAGSQLDPGETVTLIVAADRIQVPSVEGMTREEATDAIEGAGLEVGRILGDRDGRVVFTAPAPGSQVELGSKVNLIMRRGD
jgi:serine/threonine-protein kinase